MSSTSTSWQLARFRDLSVDDLYAIVRLREAVFIIEQNCPYPDSDGRDPLAWHLLGWRDGPDGRALAAYARIFEPGIRYHEASIGRIVTAPEVRGTGLGRQLMVEALRRTEKLAPNQPIKIAAQRRLEKFYTGFGFTVISEPYEEDGILHIDMVREAGRREAGGEEARGGERSERGPMTIINKTRYYGGESFADFLARPTVNHELWVALAHRVMIPVEYSARVEALHGHWHLLVLSEDWCGDAVNIVPIVAKLADSVSNMDLRILARDQNLDIMDAHLTNGKSRSIPIVILLNDKFQECGWWGPRPRALQKWVVESGMQRAKDERYKEIRTFYARDRGLTTVKEIVEMLEECCVRGPSLSSSAAAPATL